MNNISSEQNNYPAHIAIIMDGNRRWARQKNLDIREGHKKGAETLEKIAKYCNKIGIKYLTVYAFSTENWKRSSEEVGALMILLQNYLNDFSKRANTENIKIKVLGDISVLSKGMQNSINKAIERTKKNTGLTLNIAFNYGGRAEITYALKQIAEKVKNNELSIDDISEDLISNHLYTKGQPDPDLLIRTSGELRTSNFLPWQIAYTEFYFDNKYWPDFSEEDLLKAIEIYEGRNRKFGGK
ncbi:MAG: isoprenyl transferase [Clostridia bacterium]|jgi:undecaprenyl diphosphate synthase